MFRSGLSPAHTDTLSRVGLQLKLQLVDLQPKLQLVGLQPKLQLVGLPSKLHLVRSVSDPKSLHHTFVFCSQCGRKLHRPSTFQTAGPVPGPPKE